MVKVGKLVTKQAFSWKKKQFDIGVVIPSKKSNCDNCTKDLICKDCDKIINQTKAYSSNLNELKRKPLEKLGPMLPYSEEEAGLIVLVFLYIFSSLLFYICWLTFFFL